MPFEIRQVPDEPIFVVTFSDPFTPEDINGIEEIMTQKLRAIAGPICYLPDMRKVNVTFRDVVMGLAEAFKPGPNSFYRDERVHILTIGGTNELISQASQAAAKSQYGHVQIEVYSDVDEAIAAARSKYLA